MGVFKMGEFSQRLVQMMEKRGLRQADLVEKTGISRSLISAYVLGKHDPKDENLKVLADVLNCDALWLAGYDGIEEDDEKAFLEKFRVLNVEDKRTILTLLNFMNDHDRRNRDGI